MFPERVIKRVQEKVFVVPSGCWISLYSTGNHGYAQVGWSVRDPMALKAKNIVALAHRVAWYGKHRREIPVGMTIDHICRTRRCVNPDHLRLLENMDNATETAPLDERFEPVPTGRRCRRGHELLRYASGATHCRECANAAGRRKYPRRQELRRARKQK